MASGGMDTLPHNGAVITLLRFTGLNSHLNKLHRNCDSESFKQVGWCL